MVGRKDARGRYLTGFDEAMKMLVEACPTIHYVNCNNSLCTLYHTWKHNVLHLCQLYYNSNNETLKVFVVGYDIKED